jgi:sirohydrochlorin cobaltochelatase
MKTVSKFFAALFMAALLLPACSDDNNPDNKEVVKINKTKSEALLLVTFGSTWEEPQKTYDGMIAIFQREFPNADVYLSFTSTTCITRWGAKTGEYYATPDLWLDAIGKSGYEKVRIQSLHVIPGEEFTILRDYYVKRFEKSYDNIPVVLGNPLLVSDEDIEEVGDALYKNFKSRLDNGEAFAFMGHGNPESSYSQANLSYRKIEEYMQTLDPKIFVGTVDCEDMLIDYVLEELTNSLPAQTTVTLHPLMSIAGDQANNDMAGELDTTEPADAQSWKVCLNAAGYTVGDNNCILSGLGDYPAIVNVWVRHLKEAIEEGK